MIKNPLALGLAYLTVNTIASVIEQNPRATPKKPLKKVSIVLPVWHEPDWLLERTLNSLKNQTVIRAYPEDFEIVVVGCEGVNLDLIEQYADVVLCAPKGKLNARHAGITAAKGDIIVSVDGDCVYPPSWLQKHLDAYLEPNVVATAGPTNQGMLEPLVALPKHIVYMTRISGRNSTFLKDAYFKVGGFDLTIDQTNLKELWMEEELRFKNRLERIGKVAYIPSPPVYHTSHFEGRGLRCSCVTL